MRKLSFAAFHPARLGPSIVRASDARRGHLRRVSCERGGMASHGIPMDQLALYKKSVHWHTLAEVGDISAPTCNDCHGNHGAVPPGVDSVGNVCGQCHAVENSSERAGMPRSSGILAHQDV